MHAQLTYGNDSLTISNFIHDPAEAGRGNPYNSTFQLVIHSGDFCGSAPCVYNIVDFAAFVQALHKLHDFKVSTAQLRDICYGSKVDFAMDRAGHLEISGRIFGEAMLHSMEFVFSADQTVLKPFLRELDELLRQMNR